MSRADRFIVAAPVAIAGVHGGLWALGRWPARRTLAGDEQRYVHEARELAAGREVTVDLLWPPGYAEFLAGIARWADRWGVTTAIQIVLLIAGAACFAAFARHLGAGRIARRVVFLGLCCFPPLAAFAHYRWPEVLHLALFGAALWAFSTPQAALAVRAVGGAALGAALLTKSLLTPVAPLLLAALALGERGARRWLAPLAATLAMGLVVAPTLVENHRATGRWVIADSSTFNLWLGLTDTSRRNLRDGRAWEEFKAYRDSAPSAVERDRLLRARIREEVARRGALDVLAAQIGRQGFRFFDKDSYLTDQLPGGALGGLGEGYPATPQPVALGVRAVSYLAYAALLGLAALGLVGTRTSWRRRENDILDEDRGARQPINPWPWLALALVAFQIGLFLFLHVKTRYRVQLMPFLWIYAGLAAERWIEQGRPASNGRLVIGLVVGGGLLALAFGASLVDAMVS
ncbi:MAG: hypothetical protein AAGN46_02065 [Acidobacteriota bacterium]